MGGREHAADDRVPLVPVLLQASDHVVRRRRNGNVRLGTVEPQRGLLARRETLQQPDGQAVVRLPRHLHGADDGRLAWRLEERPLLDDRLDGRRRADAARVEQLIALERAAHVTGDGAAGQAKREDPLALEEERALLLVEGLVGREVDDGGVRLHLTEVRIDGRIQREVRGEADLRVEARGGLAVRAPDKRVPRLLRQRADLAEHVRQQLDPPPRREPVNAVQFTEVVKAPGALPRDEVPLALFLEATDPPPRVHAPGLHVLRAVAQLAQRNPELGGPGVRLVRHLAVPHGVPCRVPALVRQHQVHLRAGRGDVELEARALVEVAVETHADDVAGELVPAGGVLRDPGHVVVRADREVDVLVVVEDLQLGLLRRRAAFDGCLLDVVTRPLPFLPGLVVEVPVYGWRLAGERFRVVDAWGASTASVRGLRKRGQTQGARQCGDDASANRAAEAHGAKRLAQ